MQRCLGRWVSTSFGALVLMYWMFGCIDGTARLTLAKTLTVMGNVTNRDCSKDSRFLLVQGIVFRQTQDVGHDNN